MKKTQKIIYILMIVLMVVFTATTVFAASGAVDPSTLKGSEVKGSEGITDIGNQIITIISVVGSVLAVVVLIILGIKYMMGSTEEKAEYKKTMMPYIIGAALIFAASSIAGIVFSFMQNLGGTVK